MLKINHVCNSFISVEGKTSTIACDPWFGKTTDNGWMSFPIDKKNKIDKKIFQADFIYISHLHCDHQDFKTFQKKEIKLYN